MDRLEPNDLSDPPPVVDRDLSDPFVLPDFIPCSQSNQGGPQAEEFTLASANSASSIAFCSLNILFSAEATEVLVANDFIEERDELHDPTVSRRSRWGEIAHPGGRNPPCIPACNP